MSLRRCIWLTFGCIVCVVDAGSRSGARRKHSESRISSLAISGCIPASRCRHPFNPRCSGWARRWAIFLQGARRQSDLQLHPASGDWKPTTAATRTQYGSVNTASIGPRFALWRSEGAILFCPHSVRIQPADRARGRHQQWHRRDCRRRDGSQLFGAGFRFRLFEADWVWSNHNFARRGCRRVSGITASSREWCPAAHRSGLQLRLSDAGVPAAALLHPAQ